MNHPRDLRDDYRSKTYIASVFLIAFALGMAAITNYKDQYFVVTGVEFMVVLVLFMTVPLAAKKRNLELLGNFISYLVGIVLLFNATQIGGVDPGPYVGLVAMLIISSLMTVKKFSFLLYAIISYISFCALSIMGLIGLTTTVSIKYQVVYLVLIALIYMHKNYLSALSGELYKLAKKTHTEAMEIDKKANLSAEEAKDYKKQKIELEEKNKQLEKLNDLMTGREVEMKRMKEEILLLKKK
ncbi:hypothetical protein HOD30_05335 [Candidatus Peregrinibacteria bacterium]|jgi:hypothetical protein|nr:hypothetical protein [Candidatus Peregrinibacteria bacterium]MBT4631444.1 hypothetical protein [Candidatus Peregrinibacteria bacterium]MBT5516907.1 hypothetical protein [Candidatus Peregrinibacteria bacterium]MBT5823833.1 hypothetical protein [Candidatus Peregrinibacteria bacterium]